MDFTLTSSEFDNNAEIPSQFTCQGKDVSPSLSWHGAPITTKSYVLIMDDPDAPNGTWVHWVLFNIPHTINTLSLGAAIPPGATSGKNTWGSTGYRGPCPPSGQHRYYFKMYALDTLLSLTAAASKQDVETAMQNHVIGTAQLMGLYQKS